MVCCQSRLSSCTFSFNETRLAFSLVSLIRMRLSPLTMNLASRMRSRSCSHAALHTRTHDYPCGVIGGETIKCDVTKESCVHYLSHWCDKVVCIYDYQSTRLSMDTSPSWSHKQRRMIAWELNTITPKVDVVPLLSGLTPRGPSSSVGFLPAA